VSLTTLAERVIGVLIALLAQHDEPAKLHSDNGAVTSHGWRCTERRIDVGLHRPHERYLFRGLLAGQSISIQCQLGQDRTVTADQLLGRNPDARAEVPRD
jgi:hypothetical protein